MAVKMESEMDCKTKVKRILASEAVWHGFTQGQYAKLLGVSRVALHKWTWRGKIPYERASKIVSESQGRVSLEDLSGCISYRGLPDEEYLKDLGI